MNSAPPTDRALFFFFNVPPTTEIYTLSLHDALPIYKFRGAHGFGAGDENLAAQSGLQAGHQQRGGNSLAGNIGDRSEEHTSELQSQSNLVCRLLLEKKKKHGH